MTAAELIALAERVTAKERWHPHGGIVTVYRGNPADVLTAAALRARAAEIADGKGK